MLQSLYTCVVYTLLLQEDTGERRTTPDDLQGFWDMVSHQIDDVQHKFRRLEELEKNGWVVEQDVPKKKPMKVRNTLSDFRSILLWYKCLVSIHL